MKIFYEKQERFSRPVIFKELGDVRCNDCGSYIKKNLLGYLEDHVSINKTWGYGSPNDGQTHNIDLCLGCYTRWIGQFDIPVEIEAPVYMWE